MTNLRFKDYEFANNPRNLTIHYLKNTTVSSCLGFGAALQEVGPGLTIVQGEGELFGRDAMEQFAALQQLFLTKGSGTLVGAGIQPMRALFRELQLLGKGGADEISYAFEFVEERAV